MDNKLIHYHYKVLVKYELFSLFVGLPGKGRNSPHKSDTFKQHPMIYS